MTPKSKTKATPRTGSPDTPRTGSPDAARAVPPRGQRDLSWLRAKNWPQVIADPKNLDAKIRKHLQKENRRAEAFLQPSAPLREKLFAEMKSRIREQDTETPLPHGPWLYYTRQIKGGEHPLFCRKPKNKSAGKPDTLLDGNLEAAAHPYFKIGCARHSPDHRHLAWSSDISGGEEYTLRIRALARHEDLPTRIHTTDGDCVWSRDGRHLYYTRLDSRHRPSAVYRHRLGDEARADTLVFKEKNPRYLLDIESHGGGKYLAITSADHNSTAQYLLPTDDPNAVPQLVRKRERDVEYDLYFDAPRRRWLIRINIDADKGGEFCLFAASEKSIFQPDNWRLWLPSDPLRPLEDLLCLKSHILILAREGFRPALLLFSPKGERLRRLRFADPLTDIHLIEGYEPAPTQARILYSSMKVPPRALDYAPATNTRRIRKRATPRGGFRSRDYETRALAFPAEDDTLIPASLLRHRDTPLDGSAPLLLYGYGSYGYSVPTGFSLPRLSLVERGFVHVIAHARGGGEGGHAWYLGGKMENKPNSFSDFIAVARGLVTRGLARKDAIHAWGGSAGGLLMGAVANQAPELFRSIIAEVPFVDVLATMSDATLPLTPTEWLEWGNPIASPADRARIAAYSPVDNVRRQAYPFVLATAGLSDPRVGYWEPAKWVARLRESTTSGREVLLLTQMEAGHAGGAGRFQRLEEIARLYAFLCQTASLDAKRRSA